MRDRPDPENSSRPISYFIRTFGCQMNVADSLMYAHALEKLGCRRAENETSCDILVINTCSVRAKAEERAISWLGTAIRDRQAFRKRQKISSAGGIVLVGCMATVRGDEILKRFPEVRLVVPAREIDSFVDRITHVWPQLAHTAFEQIDLPILRPEEKFERFVPIIRGCINHCTYCIVPAARGNTLNSRPPDDIFIEIENLISSGVKSITFLGQNVCAYGTEISALSESEIPAAWEGIPHGYGFADLLSDVRDRFGECDTWFKFLTSHPRDVTDGLIDVLASHQSFSRHFHLPFQAGDDKVLKIMGRGYTSEFYLSLIDRIRTKIPDARLSTDIIVGFPGEDETAFEHTLDILRKVRFDAAFTFLYSPRTGTLSEKLADPVPLEEKKKRLHRLIEIQNKITLQQARTKIGQERIVLIEGPATRSASHEGGLVAGRTREEEVVILPGGPHDFGTRQRVRITAAGLRSFTAERK